MSDEPSGRDPIGEDARIDTLEDRLAAAREREESRIGNRQQGLDASYRAGNRVLAELLGGIVGGLLIGWVIDRFAGTSPWGLLVMLFLGIIVAFRNIFKISSKRSDDRP
jgi:ATP synthase protein I